MVATTTGAIDISSVFSVDGSVLWFDMLSLVILNNLSISSNTSIVFGLCRAILSICEFYHTVSSCL